MHDVQCQNTHVAGDFDENTFDQKMVLYVSIKTSTHNDDSPNQTRDP